MDKSQLGSIDLSATNGTDKRIAFHIADADFDHVACSKLISKSLRTVKAHCNLVASKLHCSSFSVMSIVMILNTEKVCGNYDDRKDFEFVCPPALVGTFMESKLDKAFLYDLKAKVKQNASVRSALETKDLYFKYGEVCELYSRRAISSCELHVIEELEEVAVEKKNGSITNLLLEMGDVLFTSTVLEMALNNYLEASHHES